MTTLPITTSTDHAKESQCGLFWHRDSVAKLMRKRRILNRDDLARAFGIPRTTVYRAFEADWSGRATAALLAALAVEFNVPLGRLVHEPRDLKRAGQTNHLDATA